MPETAFWKRKRIQKLKLKLKLRGIVSRHRQGLGSGLVHEEAFGDVLGSRPTGRGSEGSSMPVMAKSQMPDAVAIISLANAAEGRELIPGLAQK